MPSPRHALRPQAEGLEGRTLLAAAPSLAPAAVVAAGQVVDAQGDGPTITAARLTPAGITLTFGAAMDPARVGSVGNYTVRDITFRTPGLGDIASLFLMGLGGGRGTTTDRTVRLRSATYDPATQTVTLVPVKSLQASDVYTVGGRTRPGPGRRYHGPQPLTDLAGRPLVPAGSAGNVAFSGRSFTVTVGAGQGK
jgi:hypothetical protein